MYKTVPQLPPIDGTTNGESSTTDNHNKTSLHLNELNDDDYHERLPDVKKFFKNKCNNIDLKKLSKKRIPVLAWLPQYQWSFLIEDFVAGLTVGLTAIPQGIAYAVVAGLDPQYGLYSAFIGCFMYFIFGSCKDITIGPTAIMSLMVQQYVSASPDYAILLSFLSGIIIFFLGIFNLSFLVQFISIPVTVGFTSAAAITIASGQIKSLIGISGKSNAFIDAWSNLFQNFGDIKLWDTTLGVATIIFILVLRKIKEIVKIYPIACKYIALSRNALAVIFGTLLAYILYANNLEPFELTGDIVPGLPDFKLPPFSTEINNQTIYFAEMINELGYSLVSIPLIAILESIAIAKAFSNGKIIDATQEMIALGICNFMGSFVSSMPTTGSFTRTAVNHSSGVRTTLGGIFTGLLVILSLGLLTSTFYFIPKTVLAAVIITAMFFMLDIETISDIWKSKKIDIIPFIATLISCLILGLEFGILIGVCVNVLFIMYNTARPTINTYDYNINNKHILLIIPQQSITFSSAEYINSYVMKAALKNSNKYDIIIINGEFITNIDSTVAKYLKNLIDDLKLTEHDVILWNWHKAPTAIVWRLSSKMNDLFKKSPTIDELITNYTIETEKNLQNV